MWGCEEDCVRQAAMLSPLVQSPLPLLLAAEDAVVVVVAVVAVVVAVLRLCL